MRRPAVWYVSLCAVVFAARVASAQVLNPVVGGIVVGCSLTNGAPVYTTVTPINDIAKAGIGPSPIGPVPMIYINPQAGALPAPMQRFLYGHECMHHRLGHTLGNITMSMETDADCTSVRLLKSQGLLDPQSVQLVASYFVNNPPFPPFYPPGQVRANLILSCF